MKEAAELKHSYECALEERNELEGRLANL